MSRRPGASAAPVSANDPARLARERIRLRQQAAAARTLEGAAAGATAGATAASSGTSSPRAPAGSEEQPGDSGPGQPPGRVDRWGVDGELPSPGMGIERTPSLPGLVRPRSPDWEEIGEAAKRQKKLSAESESELSTFCKSGPNAAARRDVMVYSLNLEMRDLLKVAARAPVAAIDTDTQVAVRDHTRMFMFSPNLVLYRGKSPILATAIFDAMRKLNIEGLPLRRDTGVVKKFISAIGRESTLVRSEIKKKCRSSLDPTSPLHNIAALTHSLCPSGSVATLQHYMRTAFIRWHVVSYSDLKDEQFWSKVDQTIRVNLKIGAEVARGFYNDCYEDDKASYGLPEVSELAAESVADRSKDQEKIELLATLVDMEQVTVEELAAAGVNPVENDAGTAPPAE